MAVALRVIDDGERSGRHHVAFGQALIKQHRTGLSPDTLRFHSYPPTALIARDQPLLNEVAVDWCRSQGVAVARRLGGGATLYAGPGQLGWDLVVRRPLLGSETLAGGLAVIGATVAAGLVRLGVNARFHAPGRIDCDGRYLGSLGGFFDGDTAYFQGLVLVDLDPGEITHLLTVPGQRLAYRGMAATAARLVTLAALLGGAPPTPDALRTTLANACARRFGLTATMGSSSPDEEALASRLHDEVFGNESFIDRIEAPTGPGTGTAARSHSGASLAAHVRLVAGNQPVIAEVAFTGTYLVSPPNAFDVLAERLRGLPVSAVAERVEAVFTQEPMDLIRLTTADVRAVLDAAILRARRASLNPV